MRMAVWVAVGVAVGVVLVCGSGIAAEKIPAGAAIDAEVAKLRQRTQAKGIAVAVVDHGKVTYVRAFGARNGKGDPLTTDTVMYGASLTKTVFAYTVMRLVDRGKLKLDTPLGQYLEKPLPSYGPDPVFPDKYGPYKELAGRWRPDAGEFRTAGDGPYEPGVAPGFCGELGEWPER